MSALNNSEVCVDSSVLVKLAIQEDDSDQAAQVWESWAKAGIRIVAPALVWYELTSTVRKRHQRGALPHADAQVALDLLLALPLVDVTGEELHRTAYELAVRLGHLVTYDAHYLAAAALSQCALWTADRRMYDSALSVGIDAHLIAPQP